MGLITAEIELINGGDLEMVHRNLMDKNGVKRMWVNAPQLQFPVVDKRKAQSANNYIVECDVVAPVKIRFKNRSTTCRAMVLPGNSEVLLGAIPFEDMDVFIHPQRQELIVNPEHPYFARMKIK
jgi:hypothetical protein